MKGEEEKKEETAEQKKERFMAKFKDILEADEKEQEEMDE